MLRWLGHDGGRAASGDERDTDDQRETQEELHGLSVGTSGLACEHIAPAEPNGPSARGTSTLDTVTASSSVSFSAEDERPHEGLIDEWVFATWLPSAALGIVSGHRLLGGRSWYWAAMLEANRPLMHLTEWSVVVRAFDPFIVKAPEMWAEHQLDAPMEQWSIGNEAYFVALDDPADALDRAYGTPTPVAMDLEWYATGEPTPIADGYEQAGVVHGEIELMHRPNLELVEVPAHRWRRWGAELGALHTGPATVSLPDGAVMRAPFRFPDDTVATWQLSAAGFHAS